MGEFSDISVSIDEKGVAEVWQEINELIGLKPFKEWLSTAERRIRFNLASGSLAAGAAFPAKVVFSGPPGCGKATAALLVARLFHALGVITSDVVASTSVSELKLAHLGHSSGIVQEVLEKAINGTLIIEELPVFDDNDHVRVEALHFFLHALKTGEYQRTFVVFSELKEQIDNFAEEHPVCGLLLTRVEFYSFTPEECAFIFEKLASRQGYIISEDVFQYVKELAHDEQLSKGDLFANAFWVQRLKRSAIENTASRSQATGSPGNIITIEDLGERSNNPVPGDWSIESDLQLPFSG